MARMSGAGRARGASAWDSHREQAETGRETLRRGFREKLVRGMAPLALVLDGGASAMVMSSHGAASVEASRPGEGRRTFDAWNSSAQERGLATELPKVRREAMMCSCNDEDGAPTEPEPTPVGSGWSRSGGGTGATRLGQPDEPTGWPGSVLFGEALHSAAQHCP